MLSRNIAETENHGIMQFCTSLNSSADTRSYFPDPRGVGWGVYSAGIFLHRFTIVSLLEWLPTATSCVHHGS